jgi:transposase
VLELFLGLLGPERCAQIEAVSVDLYGGWAPAIRGHAPQAAICADPFHVVAQVTDALDTLRRQDWQRLRKEDPERAKWFKRTRFLLRRRAEDLAAGERTILEELVETNRAVYEGWLLWTSCGPSTGLRTPPRPPWSWRPGARASTGGPPR